LQKKKKYIENKIADIQSKKQQCDTAYNDLSKQIKTKENDKVACEHLLQKLAENKKKKIK